MTIRKFSIPWFLAVSIVLAAISAGYILIKSQSPIGGMDFHSYWYAGLFIREGTNPYKAYLADDVPTMPVSFIDRREKSGLDADNLNLATTPANTAPLVLMLSTLSFFSWPVAKNIWLIFNLIFMLLITPLTIQNFTNPQGLDFKEKLFLSLIFISLFGTRNVATIGQTSLFVFLCMLAAIWFTQRDSWVTSGLLLGLALSKYSLALPVFLFLIYKKKYREILTAILVQMMGVIILASLTRDNPLGILFQNYQIMAIHIHQSGIQLADFFPDGSILSPIVIGALTLVIGFFIMDYFLPEIRGDSRKNLDKRMQDHLLLVILMIWTLLIAYHSAYDSLVIVLFLDAGFTLLFSRRRWSINRNQSLVLGVILTLSILIFTLPASGITILQANLPESLTLQWVNTHNHLLSLALLLILGYSVWLLRNIQTLSGIVDESGNPLV